MCRFARGPAQPPSRPAAEASSPDGGLGIPGRGAAVAQAAAATSGPPCRCRGCGLARSPFLVKVQAACEAAGLGADFAAGPNSEEEALRRCAPGSRRADRRRRRALSLIHISEPTRLALI
eukprot:5430969-Alexandrium_andersonii.AAC.1